MAHQFGADGQAGSVAGVGHVSGIEQDRQKAVVCLCSSGRPRHAPSMTDHKPTTIGDTLEQVLERVIFEDPATHRLRDEWHETKRVEQAVYDRVCREEYERRLDYHRICQTPDPDQVAWQQANLCKQLFREELDSRLALRWADVLRRVQTVLADKAAAGSAETPGTGSDVHRADSSGT